MTPQRHGQPSGPAPRTLRVLALAVAVALQAPGAIAQPMGLGQALDTMARDFGQVLDRAAGRAPDRSATRRGRDDDDDDDDDDADPSRGGWGRDDDDDDDDGGGGGGNDDDD